MIKTNKIRLYKKYICMTLSLLFLCNIFSEAFAKNNDTVDRSSNLVRHSIYGIPETKVDPQDKALIKAIKENLPKLPPNPCKNTDNWPVC